MELEPIKEEVELETPTKVSAFDSDLKKLKQKISG